MSSKHNVEKNNFDMSIVILNNCSPGKYLGNNAQIKLNKITDGLHAAIITYCKEFSLMNLMTNCYQSFDECCYHALKKNHWNLDYKTTNNIEAAPSALSYLTNTIICANSQSTKENDKETFLSLIQPSFFMIHACEFSNMLFYNDFQDGFEVDNKGNFNMIISEKTEKIQDKIRSKVGQRRLTVGDEKLWNENLSWDEMCSPYDLSFKQHFGLSLTETTNIIKSGFRQIKIEKGAVICSYKDLLKLFSKGHDSQRSNVQKAIRLFETSSSALQVNWNYSKIREMRPSSSRQPIVHLSGGIGKGGIVVYGPNTLLRALMLLFADLDRGVINFGSLTEQHLREKGTKFEDKIRKLLEDYGFQVIHPKNKKNPAGEIDCIAFLKCKGILLVIEAKSPKIDLGSKEIIWQIKDSKKWVAQLMKKMDWVSANIAIVAQQLGIKTENIKDIKDYVVVEVPIFIDDDVDSEKIITIEDLFYMLEKMIWE